MPQGQRPELDERVGRDFIPARFNLYEFDHFNCAAPGGRRWFSHWDGLIGAPAEEVSLAWSKDAPTVLVCSSGPIYDRAEARLRSAHLALGGSDLPVSRRGGSPAETLREIERIATTEKIWVGIASLLRGLPAGEVVVCDGWAATYARLDSGAIFVAAVDIEPPQLKVRRVQDWVGCV